MFSRSLVLAPMLVLILATAACQPPEFPTDEPEVPTADVVEEPSAEPPTAEEVEGTEEVESVLRVALDVPVQLDPAFASSDSEVAVLGAVYDYLVDIDGRNEIQPRLAESWDVGPEGLVYTFTLASGVTFHDGQALTAEDVVWTFDRLRDPEAGLPTSDLYANIEAINAVTDDQVFFRLAETNPFFLYDLSDNHAVVLKADTEDPATAFNGTGPFEVEDYRPEDRMALVANEGYHIEGKPGVDRLELVFFREETAAVDALRGGQVDLMLRMSSSLFLSLENEPGINPTQIPTNGFDLVRLRSDRPPGNDTRVVQALKLATDRTTIFHAVTQGLGAVGRDSPIGPLYASYYSEETPMPERDVESARDLLAQAGYTDGLKIDLHTPDTGNRPDLAVVLKEQWAEVGVDVNVIKEPENVYYGEDGWLEVDLGITGWESRPAPQFYLDVMLVCGAKWNESKFCDPEFDELAELAGTTLDEEERIRAYHEIQSLLLERGPIIIPYFFAQLGAIRAGFDGFELKAFAGRTDLAAIGPTR